MKPIGPLMIDHRVVERMLALLERENKRMRETGAPDYAFIDKAVAFFETFVDRFHHGKEERILFSLLSAKSLSQEHSEIMRQLIAEHAHTRDALHEFRQTMYRRATDKELLDAAVGLFETLIKWYPLHIEKEDRHFFIPAMEYFSEQEQAAMLEDFSRFDMSFVHERYEEMIRELGGQTV